MTLLDDSIFLDDFSYGNFDFSEVDCPQTANGEISFVVVGAPVSGQVMTLKRSNI